MKENPESPKTITGLGHGQSLKMHLKKAGLGKGWTHLDPKDPGPDVGQKYNLPQKEDPSLEEPHCRKSDKDTTFLCEDEPQQEAAS